MRLVAVNHACLVTGTLTLVADEEWEASSEASSHGGRGGGVTPAPRPKGIVSGGGVTPAPGTNATTQMIGGAFPSVVSDRL